MRKSITFNKAVLLNINEILNVNIKNIIENITYTLSLLFKFMKIHEELFIIYWVFLRRKIVLVVQFFVYIYKYKPELLLHSCAEGHKIKPCPNGQTVIISQGDKLYRRIVKLHIRGRLFTLLHNLNRFLNSLKFVSSY